jgi:arabinogalactan endo-1,4-beta-galactosidase
MKGFRRLNLTLLAAVAGLRSATGQALLYEEAFPYAGASGDISIGTAGWTNLVPNNPQRLFQLAGNDGAVYAYQSSADVPVTTAFYTTSALDQGSTGTRFSLIDLSLVGGLRLSVDIRPYYTPDSVTARFALLLNGTNWFCEANPLPVPTAQSSSFLTYVRAFNPAASNWNVLTLNASNATIGATATSTLAGSITGAGMVFRHTGHAGTHDFDNFRIYADALRLVASPPSNGRIGLSWPGGPAVRLQRADDLRAPAWRDVTNTLGQAAASVPFTGSQALFRLSTMSTPVDDSTNLVCNSGFEADGAPVPTPYGWSTSGAASATAVAAGGYAGYYSLQHSNAVAYQVETSQLVTSLPNGFYSLSAYAKSSGGQKVCYLAGNERLTSLPPIAGEWTPVIVRGIEVTNGQCLVRVYSDAAPSNWCRLDEVMLVKDDVPYRFLKGGDISELTYLEQGGGRFYETNGVQMDCLQILRNHGFNIARLRLYNDPGNTNYSPSNLLPAGIQSPTNILHLAARAKAQGLQLELTFYYSDYWTNGKPHDWTGLSLPQLTNAVYAFTTNFMTLMKNQGTTPEYVSLGNEIGGGLLLPDGASSNFPRLAQLLKAGYAAIKQVSPTTQVILHVGDVDAATVEWFFSECVANGVQWDIIGCSYYPFWTGLTSQQARTNIDQFYPLFNKPVLIMETGYNWSTNACDGWPGQLSNNGPEVYPSTPLGQKAFLLKCFNDLKLVAGGHCIGGLYWDPIFICVPGLGWQLGARNVVDNATLFDFTGHALPSLDAFNYNN